VADGGLYQHAAAKTHLTETVTEFGVFAAEKPNLVRGRIALRHQGHGEQSAGSDALLVLILDILADLFKMLRVQGHNAVGI
jgi:hypothetical protein